MPNFKRDGEHVEKEKPFLVRLDQADYNKLEKLKREFKKGGIPMPINSLINIAVKDLLKKDKGQIISSLTKR
jgi:hypothetical protein